MSQNPLHLLAQPWEVQMYRLSDSPDPTPENFEIPFNGQLSPENRWVILSSLVPWSEFEEEYRKNFSSKMGAPAHSFRTALGALIIKEKLGTSARETVEQIRENPYLQYFLGYSDYRNKAPFEASMFVHFRKRISPELINQINQNIIKQGVTQKAESAQKKKKENENPLNRGQLILDATCAPGDIRYPHDLGLLNQARRQTEKIIDYLRRQPQGRGQIKPRTYRKWEPRGVWGKTLRQLLGKLHLYSPFELG